MKREAGGNEFSYYFFREHAPVSIKKNDMIKSTTRTKVIS